jgi:hypothetical protein
MFGLVWLNGEWFMVSSGLARVTWLQPEAIRDQTAHDGKHYRG